MPNYPPPPDYDGVPRPYDLPAGSRLSRVFTTRFGVVGFNPTLAPVSEMGGGRFDATGEDRYAHLYAGDDDPTAISEALLRDLAFDHRGARLLPRAKIAGRSLAWLRPTRTIRLVSLRSGEDLAAVGQDGWLTTCPAGEYPDTRWWAHAIRGWAPWASGLTWHSRLEPDGFAYVLFADRCPEGLLEEVADGVPLPEGDRALDRGEAELYLRQVLLRYRVTLYP
jgi:RES domain